MGCLVEYIDDENIGIVDMRVVLKKYNIAGEIIVKHILKFVDDREIKKLIHLYNQLINLK